MRTFTRKPGAQRRTVARSRLPQTEERSRPQAILALQQTIGNRSVQRLLAQSRPGRDGDLRGEPTEDESDVRPGVAGVQREGECKASATGVSLGESGPIKTATKYGLRTPIIVSGTELADVLDSELVGASIDHTGSMTKRPSAKSNNSGFMKADKIPDDRHTSSIANHLSYYDNHGGDGSYARLQMDLYKIPGCGINDPKPIPNSGYRIKREVKAEGTKVVGIVTKTAEAVTIGTHTSTAGLTAKKEAKVTLRE
jgi:hypothetical protein